MLLPLVTQRIHGKSILVPSTGSPHPIHGILDKKQRAEVRALNAMAALLVQDKEVVSVMARRKKSTFVDTIAFEDDNVGNPDVELTPAEVQELQAVHEITAFTNSSNREYGDTTNIKLQTGSSRWTTVNNIPFDQFFLHNS
jgi:hypothetical protein